MTTVTSSVPADAPSCSWDDVPPTRSQLACLARMGIDARTVGTKQQASRIIGSTPHATPTVKQIELLTRKGFRNVSGWTYRQAHELITRISDNRWTIPADIGDPAAYRPC